MLLNTIEKVNHDICCFVNIAFFFPSSQKKGSEKGVQVVHEKFSERRKLDCPVFQAFAGQETGNNR